MIGYSYGRDGDNFRIPDLRESVPVGAGHNETNVFDSTEEDPNTGNPGTQNHDEYTVGQFKDDQFQGHKHLLTLSEQKHNGSLQNELNVMTGGIIPVQAVQYQMVSMVLQESALQLMESN